MATSTTYGYFSESEVYTINEIASRCEESPRWVQRTFLVPQNHVTGKRLTYTDADGRERRVPGVHRLKAGRRILVPGRSLNAWIIEWGDRGGTDLDDEE